jgi:two-component system, cell cycle response regulator
MCEPDALLAAYLDLIRDIAEAVELIRPEVGVDFRRQLIHAHARLSAGASREVLEETRNTLHAELKLFSEQIRRQQAELAYLDPLTSVPNRREFDRQLAARFATSADFCILLFDLDHFKSANDRYGHLCGDEILRQLGARLSRQVRTRDFVCRWGGDEFVVILDCDMATASARALKISQWLSGPYRVTANGQEIQIEVAVSFGVAQRLAGETPEQLFHRVDESLYSKKGTADY